jgi:hypothetical protein
LPGRSPPGEPVPAPGRTAGAGPRPEAPAQPEPGRGPAGPSRATSERNYRMAALNVRQIGQDRRRDLAYIWRWGASAKNARSITNRHWKWPQGCSAVAAPPPGRRRQPAQGAGAGGEAGTLPRLSSTGRLYGLPRARRLPAGSWTGRPARSARRPRPQWDGRPLRVARRRLPHALLPHLRRQLGRCRVVRRPDGRGPRATVRGRRGRRFFRSPPTAATAPAHAGRWAARWTPPGAVSLDTAPASTAPPHPKR